MRLMSHRRNNTRLSIEALEPREVPASIAGRVFLDFDNSGVVNGPDTGIPTVTIKLSGGTLTSPLTQTTDAQGNFSFTNLAAGTYTLTETQPTTPANQSGKTMAGSVGGTNATTNTISTILLGSTTTATGYNFAEVPLVGTGGSVFEDKNGNGVKDSGDSGIANVIVTLTGTSIISGAITPKTATTDVNGNYSFTGLTPGTYMLTEAQPVHTPTVRNRTARRPPRSRTIDSPALTSPRRRLRAAASISARPRMGHSPAWFLMMSTTMVSRPLPAKRASLASRCN